MKNNIYLSLNKLVENHQKVASKIYGKNFNSNIEYINSKYRELFLIQYENLVKQN